MPNWPSQFETARAAKQVATGGLAKVEKLYRLLNAQQAARFLGRAEPAVRNMSYRHELARAKLGSTGTGHRLLDLTKWQEARAVPVHVHVRLSFLGRHVIRYG